MNKKIRNLIILVVALGGLLTAYFVLFSGEKDGSMSDEETKFAVEDTAAIQKITFEKVVRDTVKSTLTLTRRGTHWQVNDQYVADPSQVENMLTTLHRLTPVAVLTDKGKQTSLQRLKTNHTQVEVRGAEGVMKRFKIGPTNKDQTGNVMLLEGAKNPAVIAREGMVGYVSIYFTTTLNRWRSRTLINEHPDGLASVRATYTYNPDMSFELTRGENDTWVLAEGLEANPERVARYLGNFMKPAAFESFAEQVYPQMVDSLEGKTPDIQLSYTNQLGLEKTVSLFIRGPKANNYFGWVEGEKELLTIQKYVIDSFLVPVDYFVPGPL
jgi:hypothetical protein